MNRKFIILGNMNACTYKEVFPYIKNNEIWLGLAADIHPKSGNILDLAKTIISSGVEYDQVLLEYVTRDKDGFITDCKWIHVGFGRQSNRNQILAYNGQQYKPVKITTETRFRA